ncbi:CusA/CzcA family heavy metal efflux RND transporter [Thermoflexibacter ruber]|uniref:Cobalt-zinc-cadmium resistance protein CzcA n=1 Tax=Thermoflexibacter ruber TaxID=1003 RepID=A0A1I2I201_9BACT|nr:CusA/CzcA family heavy metal efflux RND transporter [Thermoflexibacter ruber]SFF36429.1 cobalt-zinc-cadmium resistance protein CzcA [Thermoflexibacter ruber]
MLDRIIHFSIYHKFIIGLFTLALVLWGGYALTQLPIDAVPDITNNQVQVVTYSPSLAAQEVERLITFPVEQTMMSIPYMEEMRSISRFGLSVLTIVFKEDIDIYWARQQVFERIQQAQNQIPAGVGVPELMPITTGLGEIYQYVIHPKKGYEKKYSLADLRTIQDWIVRRQMLGTEGVADVSSFGGYVKQYEIAFHPEKLRSMNLTIDDIFSALEKNNQNTGGAYIDKRPNAYFIRSEGLISTIADIEQIMVSQAENGLPIFIKDIAKVQLGSAVRYGAMTRNNDGEVVGGIVMMLKGENSSKVIAKVKERMKQIEKTLPEGIAIEAFLDRTKLVNNAIQTVVNNLTEGALIVIFVLVLLLGNLRAGLVVASVIPLSLLFAIIMMNLFGVSGNLMSLGAIDFGLIVDGAVIIVEATLHHLHSRSLSLPSSEATSLTQSEMNEEVYHSASKIRTSAAFGEIIIMIVYLPLLTLIGIEGKMFKPMAQTVSFAILGAFLLSLTYVPMMSALVLSKKINFKVTIADRIIHTIYSIYKPLINKVLKIPFLIVSLAVILFSLSLMVFSRLGGEFIPSLDEGDFTLEVRLFTGSSLDETVHTSLTIAEILKKNFSEVEEVIGKIGAAEIPTDPMPLEASDVMVILKNKSEWKNAHTKEELAEKMQAKLEENIAGVSIGFQQPIQMRFNELMTGARQDVVLKIYGEDLNTLAQEAEKLAKLVQKVDGVADLYVEKVIGLPQIIVNFDREKIAQFGLSIAEANDVLSTAFAGKEAGVVYEGDRRYQLVVRLAKENRENIDDVRNLFITNKKGEQIPLSQIAEISFKEGANQIQREEGKRRVIVAFNVRGRDVESIVNEIQQEVGKKLSLPPGYYITYGGSFKNLQEAKQRLSIAVPIALGMIFMLLYFTFHSIRQSLLIFTAIPLSAIGGILMLWLRDMPFSISAGVGFIALFGVAVLNGIVLIAEFNFLKKQKTMSNEQLTIINQQLSINNEQLTTNNQPPTSNHQHLIEIIMEGTKNRLRPVLMTAAVASLGFLPMALSQGAGAEVQKPLATVVIGGLISATLLTLFVLPALYYLIEKWAMANSQSHKGLLSPSLLKGEKLAVFIFLMLSLLLTSCDGVEEKLTETQETISQASNKVELTTEQFANAGIELGELSQMNVSKTLKVNGMIDVPPQNLVSISIPMGGFIKNTEMLQGLKVKKGQVLAVIENPDFIQLQQDYLDTQSKLEYAQAEYERQAEMQKEKVTSEKLVQQSTADYKSLQIKLKALEQRLKLVGLDIEKVKKGEITNQVAVTAPISGYVITVNVNIGKYVSPAEVLFEIVNNEHLHAELNVFEKDVLDLKIGQKVLIMLGNETHEHEGEIYLINHKINPDRTVSVHVHFDDKGEDIMPKTFLKGIIEIDKQKVWALPEQAFVLSEGKDYIFVYLGKNEGKDTFEMVEVKKGASEKGFAEIILPEQIDLKGKKIATKGSFHLLAKMKNIGEEE